LLFPKNLSSDELNHEIADKYPLEGISYYRLNQTDFDGRTEYFDIESVKFEPYLSRFKLYPNPATNFKIPYKYSGHPVEIFDSQGRKLTNTTTESYGSYLNKD
jgi:hypothetical protein